MLDDALKDLATGTFILILALLTWRMTENIFAWGLFFSIGTVYIVLGLIKVIRSL